MAEAKSMDAIMALCKRRGFVYQASEIYGGINGFWDYGPLGAQLKKNLREAWWQDMIMNPCWGRKGPNGERVRCVPLETRIIQHPKVWEASGHVGGFNDPMVDCKACKSRFRADHVWVVGWSDRGELADINDRFPDFPAQEYEEAMAAGDWQRAVEYVKECRRVQRLDAMLTDSWQQPKFFKSAIGGSISECADNLSLSKRELKAFKQPAVVWSGSLAECRKDLGRTPACPNCEASESLTEPRQFNLMFSTYVGATATGDDKAYLRPETAQGIFVQFKNVVDTTRVKIPFGIGNTGTSFRNEVTPRNFTFRSREFEQAELEFFCHPDESQDWYKFWRDFRMEWWKSIGLAGDNLILREHEKDELSHYSVGTSDVEYRFPFTSPGFGELEGIAHRGCFDLTQHQEHSKVKLDYFDPARGAMVKQKDGREIPAGERYMPHCIEPAAGLDRGALALMCEAYTRDESRPSPEIMKFHPRVAPIKAAVFPLVDKDGMPEVAERLYDELRARFGRDGFIETDAKQSIGKRYARMDEGGCPFCFTIDGETLKDQTVTVRDRDTGQQQRIGLEKVTGFLGEKLGG
ncbi:MAG: glycine--tRNA ligase [Phycisphaerales bacterium]